MVEGILVAKKDFNAPGHIDLHKIPNLQVIKACQSLTSRGYVKTQFSWQYYYYTLTNEGIGMYPLSIEFSPRSLQMLALLHILPSHDLPFVSAVRNYLVYAILVWCSHCIGSQFVG